MRLLLPLLFILSLGTSYSQTKHLTVESNHSTVLFEVPIAGGMTKVIGKFNSFDLQLALVDNDLTKSEAIFTIDVSSIDTGIPDRDEHLKTSDFFHVDSFPSITFTTEQIVKTNEGYMAKGVFEMHGVRKQMDLPLIATGEDGNTLGFEIETKINRIDFGVGKDFKHSAIDNFLSDHINVRIYFWTKRDKRFDDN